MKPNEKAAMEELMWELSAPHSLQAIADRLGMSEKLVHQIEKRALKKLRVMLGEEWSGPLRSDDRVGYLEDPRYVFRVSGNGRTRKNIDSK